MAWVASEELVCIWYLLRPWLGLMRPVGMDPCPPAPSKRPDSQDASLDSRRQDLWTHREPGVRLGVTFFFLLMYSRSCQLLLLILQAPPHIFSVF